MCESAKIELNESARDRMNNGAIIKFYVVVDILKWNKKKDISYGQLPTAYKL